MRFFTLYLFLFFSAPALASSIFVGTDGKNVLVVTPKQAAPGKPWVWHGEFFGHKPAPDIALLKQIARPSRPVYNLDGEMVVQPVVRAQVEPAVSRNSSGTGAAAPGTPSIRASPS